MLFFKSNQSVLMSLLEWIVFLSAIAFPFILIKFVEPSAYSGSRVLIMYLIALLVYFLCWSALSVLEKISPHFLFSSLLTTIGLWLLISLITLAFIKFSWWVVLLSLPLVWILGGWLGGKLARIIRIPLLWACIGVVALSVMYHSIFM